MYALCSKRKLCHIHLTYTSVGQSVSQSVSQSIRPSVSQSVSKLVSQSVSQSASQPVGRSVGAVRSLVIPESLVPLKNSSDAGKLAPISEPGAYTVLTKEGHQVTEIQ